MKLLKSLFFVGPGVAATKLFPEQVEGVIMWAKGIDAESIKVGITAVKDFVVDIYNAAFGMEAPAAS